MLPNLHVALCAYATYLLMDDAGTLGWSDLAWLAMKVSVVRNLIITSGVCLCVCVCARESQ